ncbi:MAG: hypothetical protein AB8F78_10800 [Saprospiraceae bacterium]
MFDEADIVLQGQIVSDTVYEANGWIYTSYIIEPCTYTDDSQSASRGKPLAITRMGGDLDGVSYSKPHGLEIFGGEQAVFFLKYIEGDTITASDLTSVQPICGQAGFAKYLTDDWKPIVAMGETVLSAAEFRTQMKEYIEFEYCKTYPSYYIAAPSLTFEDGSPTGEIGFAYESHNQLPAQPMTIEFQFEEPMADQALDNASFSLSEAIDYDAESLDPFTLSVTYYLDSFPTYLDSIVSLGSISYSLDELSALSNVRAMPVEQTADPEKSELDRVIYQEETPGKEGFKRATITEITSEVVAGIRRPLSLPILAGAPNPAGPARSGIVTIKGTEFNDYTQAELNAKIPVDIRIDLVRESLDLSNVKTISPLAGDFIYWTDSEIKFYAPTLGYIDYATSTSSLIERAGSFGGRILVVTEGGQALAPSRTEVVFNQRSSPSGDPLRIPNPFMTPSSDDISMRKQLKIDDFEAESTERGLTFIIDPSFTTSLKFRGADFAEAKIDLCDAAGEWTKATGIPIDIVETCPVGIECSIINGGQIGVSTASGEVLAAGTTRSTAQPSCSAEEPRAFSAELRFSNVADPPVFISRALSSTGGGRDVIYDLAMHEFGHILQQNHVDNPNELMFPIARGSYTITPAAIECGIHVSNVSQLLNGQCSNVLEKSFIATDCSTSPTSEAISEYKGINIQYDLVSKSLRVNIDPIITEKFELIVYDAVGRQVFVRKCENGENRFVLRQMPLGFYSAYLKGGKTQIATPFVNF